MATFNTLEELFFHHLQDLLDAERQLLKALPKMAGAANSVSLSTAFSEHLQETQGHVASMTKLLETLGVDADQGSCAAIEGVIAEGENLIAQRVAPPVLDAALIASAQQIEHLEIAGYGTAKAWAELLGHRDAAAALAAILNQEKAADSKLSLIALTINPQADEPPSHDDAVVIAGRAAAQKSRQPSSL